MARTAIQAVAMVSSLVDTQESIVIEPRAEVRSLSRRHLFWAIPLAVIGFVGIGAIAVTAVLPSTLVASKRDCARSATTPAAAPSRVLPKRSSSLWCPQTLSRWSHDCRSRGRRPTTATARCCSSRCATPELSVLEWWVGRHNGAVDPKSYADLYATETPQQQETRGHARHADGKETAEFVALKRLGFDAKLTPGEVIIDALVCLKGSDDGRTCLQFAPSDKLLDPGDKLLKVDGTSLAVVDDLAPVLAKHKPGDKVEIEYERDGKAGSGEVELIASPDDPDRTIIGFIPSDTAVVNLPPRHQDQHRHRIDRWPFSGSGLHADTDRPVVEGDLLGGKRIAVTGTIDINAKVGAIGGLTSKASAVMQSGAKYFLVPTSQGEADIADARKVVGDAVEIIPVATLDEALAALATHRWRVGAACAPVDAIDHDCSTP